MTFYELTYPQYETDFVASAANPLRQMNQIGLPGIRCSVCGSTWAGTRRLYLPIEDPALRRLLAPRNIPDLEWREVERLVREATPIPSDFQLLPGDRLGLPIFELTSSDVMDIMQPFPGQFVVTSNVIEALASERISGFRVVPAEVRTTELRWQVPPSNPEYLELPSLYEIAVTGVASSAGSDLDTITICNHCGRKRYPSPGSRVVDLERWDGSDFFHLDGHTNRVFVTEKVEELFLDSRFTNYACNPLPPPQ